MTSSSNDTDREALIALLGDELGWDWNPAPGVPSSRKVLGDIADRILTEFLPGHDERVKAEAWDEGLLVGQDPYGFDTTNNPYRKAGTNA
jgi:hypothetical protein